MELFQCAPQEAIQNSWVDFDGDTSGTRYMNQSVTETVSALFNFLSDFATLILPISTVWKVNVRLRNRPCPDSNVNPVLKQGQVDALQALST